MNRCGQVFSHHLTLASAVTRWVGRQDVEVVCVLVVMLQPMEGQPVNRAKHKFMVQTMMAPPGFQSENVDAVVRNCCALDLYGAIYITLVPLVFWLIVYILSMMFVLSSF